MAVTVYHDTTFKVGSVQARTDVGGAPVTDVDGEELRLYADLFTGGVLKTNDFAIAPGAGYSLDVGSGTPKSDVAVLDGVSSGQGNYLVRQELGSVNVPLTAADLAQSRLDELYVVVEDDPYDSSGRSLPRLAVREGDLSGSPIAPGPDPAWQASLLLATISIPNGATSVAPGEITDERTTVGLAVTIDPSEVGAPSEAEFDAHVADVSNPHVVTALQVDAYERANTYTQAEVDGIAAGKSGSDHDHDVDYAADPHVHSGVDITTGEVDSPRMKLGNGTNRGALRLSDVTNGASGVDDGVAGTPKAVKAAFDKGNHSHPYSEDDHEHGRYYDATLSNSQLTITRSSSSPSGGNNGDIWLQVP